MIDRNDLEEATPHGVPVQANGFIDDPYTAVKIPRYALHRPVQSLVSFMPAALMLGGVP
jgi:hypothetical protein